MRQIAMRLLPPSIGQVYVDRELAKQQLGPLPPPKDGHLFHLCAIASVPGSIELLTEAAAALDVTLTMAQAPQSAVAPGTPNARRRSTKFKRRGTVQKSDLYCTTDMEKMGECDHVFLYLTGQTWTRGEEASAALAEVVSRAMTLRVHLLLAHESEFAARRSLH
jgi:hypothetical protein